MNDDFIYTYFDMVLNSPMRYTMQDDFVKNMLGEFKTEEGRFGEKMPRFDINCTFEPDFRKNIEGYSYAPFNIKDGKNTIKVVQDTISDIYKLYFNDKMMIIGLYGGTIHSTNFSSYDVPEFKSIGDLVDILCKHIREKGNEVEVIRDFRRLQ